MARDTALSAGAVIRDALEKCILTEAAGLDIHLVLSYMHCIVLINIFHVYAKSALEENILSVVAVICSALMRVDKRFQNL